MAQKLNNSITTSRDAIADDARNDLMKEAKSGAVLKDESTPTVLLWFPKIVSDELHVRQNIKMTWSEKNFPS